MYVTLEAIMDTSKHRPLRIAAIVFALVAYGLAQFFNLQAAGVLGDLARQWGRYHKPHPV